MPITASDILLLASERMADTADGGGRRTANVIPDGVAGNIFPKVSRADVTAGRVNLRKVYGNVDTDDVDTYAGAHAIITTPPANAKISCVLFSTGSDFDTRTEARDRIESFVVYGPESKLRVYGRQPIGSKAVLCYQRETETLPEVGEVYCLTHEVQNSATFLATQYIRIDSLAHEVREFEDERGIYKMRVITLGVTQPITYSFAGPDTPPRLSTDWRPAKVRATSVADAARYYGIQPLSDDALTGALSVQVGSIYAPVVPTTLRESAISLAEIGGATAYLAAGATFAMADNSIGAQAAFPAGVAPGSVTWVARGTPCTDDGLGAITLTPYGSNAAASVDYETGLMVPNVSFVSELWSATATHAVQVSQPAHTYNVDITIGNRGSLYSEVLSPVPAPGTLIVDYRALGKWYRLRDNTGDGTLAGQESSWGTGSVDYINGGAVITLGALPDVGSAVIFSWGSPVHYTQRTGAADDADANLRQEIQLANAPVASGSVVLTLQYAGSPVVLTLSSDTASNANLSASVNIHTGLIAIQYTGALPDAGTIIEVDYEKETEEPSSPDPILETWQGDIYGLTAIALGGAVVAGSVRVSLPMLAVASAGEGSTRYQATVSCIDDGAGTLRVGPHAAIGDDWLRRASLPEGAAVGAINYSTGSVGIATAVACTAWAWVTPLGTRDGEWVSVATTAAARTAEPSTVQQATVRYRPAGATSSADAVSETFTPQQAPLLLDLTTTLAHSVSPGSVVFRLGSSTTNEANRFVDRSGALVRNVLIASGSATTCGQVNYETGLVRIWDWPGNGLSSSVVLQSCLTYYGEFSTDRIQFRTAGSPVRTGSLYVRATAADGTVITGTSDANGIITGALIAGTCNQEFGVVSVRFGEWMPKAGNEAEDWYNADNIDPEDATQVWKPTMVLTSTLRYSAVVTTNVALDPALLGLDPVRLPIDGRVPIFRPGNLAVVHQTEAVTLPNPAVAGATYSAGRTNVTDIWLVDASGVRVDPTLYGYSLSAGTVTMADPLTLTGIAQPLVMRHRISDMVLITDATIDGRIDIASPLSQAYGTDAYISSALMFGDLNARVASVFDQQTWLDEWLDTVDGAGADAQYNDVLYPIEVLNSAAITERWRLEFTSTTAFRCYGENSGLIATGSTGADFGPVNPLTLEPYFVVRAGGWGSGWGVGNNLRFNTFSAGAPIWMARTVLPGAALTADAIDVQLRGDVDA